MQHLPGFCAVIRVARVWRQKQSDNAIAIILLSSPAAVATSVTICKYANHITAVRDTHTHTHIRPDWITYKWANRQAQLGKQTGTNGQTDRHKSRHLREGVKATVQVLVCSVIQTKRRIELSLNCSWLNCEIVKLTF